MTTLTTVAPPATSDAAIWDARAEFNVGTFVLRYLAEVPAPDGARFEADLATWGANLARRGRERLNALDASPMRVVGGDA